MVSVQCNVQLLNCFLDLLWNFEHLHFFSSCFVSKTPYFWLGTCPPVTPWCIGCKLWTQKKYRIQNVKKCLILLTTFSCHLSLDSCRGQICHIIILVKVSYCVLMLFSFKMSHWEVLRAFQSLRYWHFPKMYCLPPKLLKRCQFLKKTTSIVIEKISLIYFFF